MTKTSGLGRGLSSLIPTKKSISADGDNNSTTPVPSAVAPLLDTDERIEQLSVDAIVANPHQPRTAFDSAELDDLAASIKEHGIILPLIATKVGDGQWQLIAGERRLRAAKLAGLKTVPVIVRDLNEQKQMELALIENLQRADLNPLEVARVYQKLIDEFNLTQDQLGKRVGKSRPAVTNTLRLLGVHQTVRTAIENGEISGGHARVLAGLPEEDQLTMLKKIKELGMTVRDTEQAGRQVVVEKHIRKLSVDPEMREREAILQAALGTKVEIKKSGTGGQIIIKFFSLDELEGIISHIN